jgi:Sigma-70, region 4
VAVVLCDLYRVPYAKAAQILEVPVGTVKSRVFRGRVALAERLGQGADRPTLRVVGGSGTEPLSRASEPSEPDRPSQE